MNPRFIQGGGRTGAIMRSRDWSTHPFGPVDTWPAALRITVAMMLNSPKAMSLSWGDHRSFLFNDGYITMLGGKNLEWAMGRDVAEVWPEAWPILGPLRHNAMHGESKNFDSIEMELERYGYPEKAFFDFSYSPIWDENDTVSGVFCISFEITDKVFAERTRLWEIIGQSGRSPICAFDKECRLIAFNQAHSDEFYRIYRYRVQIGDVFWSLFEKDQAPVIRGFMERALAGETFHVVQEFGDPEIIVPYWDIAYTPLLNEQGGIIGAFHHAQDITDKLRAQDELETAQEALRQSQKMEAVGQLTGGIAHDFNNLLTGVLGNIELIETRMQQGRVADLERYIRAAQSAGKRAASLTQRLLAFSRRQNLDPKCTNVNRLITGMEDLIRRTIGPSVELEVVGSASLWSALIDPSQLENALLNLCINARDAMPDGGRIVIETANKWLDDRAATDRDLPTGQYLAVSVTDNGSGMPKDVIERAFEPFFTTKPTGQGTGLGLSMIYGFTRQSGGQVRIYSEENLGTTITMYLPRHMGCEEGEVEAVYAKDTPLEGRSATVLLIDDEPTIRQLACEVLEELGYRVMLAEGAPSATAILDSRPDIDIMVTDVGLPGGMNGRQIADLVRERYDNIPVLFITGYAENAVIGHGNLAPGMEVLTKPFSLDEMARRVTTMLDRY